MHVYRINELLLFELLLIEITTHITIIQNIPNIIELSLILNIYILSYTTY